MPLCNSFTDSSNPEAWLTMTCKAMTAMIPRSFESRFLHIGFHSLARLDGEHASTEIAKCVTESVDHQPRLAYLKPRSSARVVTGRDDKSPTNSATRVCGRWANRRNTIPRSLRGHHCRRNTLAESFHPPLVRSIDARRERGLRSERQV